MNHDRLENLEAKVDLLSTSVQELQSRLAQIEGIAPAVPSADPTEQGLSQVSLPPGDIGPSPTRFFFLLGQSILALAGGFLLRALTEGGSVTGSIGFSLGTVYILLLMGYSWFRFSKNDRQGGTALGLAAVLVAYPFLTESIIKLNLVPALVGAAALIGLTGAGLWLAWSQRQRFLAWAFIAGSLLTLMGFNFTSKNPELFAGVMLLLGAATIFLAYSRHWHIKRWAVAMATNAVFLRLTIMSLVPPDRGSGSVHADPGVMLQLNLALLGVYLAAFCYRALVQGKGVKVFDVIQSALVLTVGFGGAVYIANGTNMGAAILGWVALVAALVFYSVAFTFVRSRLGRGRGFFYFASLALVFLFLGSQVIAHGPWLSWIWLLLGLITAILGSGFHRVTLRFHSIIYLLLGSLQSGLFRSAGDAFLGSATSAWHSLDSAGFVNVATILFVYLVFLRHEEPLGDSQSRRTPTFLAALLLLMSLGFGVINMLVHLLGQAPPLANPATVSVIRTAVLSATAVTLAWISRRAMFRELNWLVYPLLGLGLVKILVEDLRLGGALSLFVGFCFLGTALILAPKLAPSFRAKPVSSD